MKGVAFSEGVAMLGQNTESWAPKSPRWHRRRGRSLCTLRHSSSRPIPSATSRTQACHRRARPSHKAPAVRSLQAQSEKYEYSKGSSTACAT